MRNPILRTIRYAKRSYYWKKNSEPFLSGDLFADKSDIAMYPPKFRGPKPTKSKVAKANVIFCPSDYIESFLEEYKNFIHAKVLIVGNGDRDFLEFPNQLPSSVKQVFMQNLQFMDSRFSCLPIGLENIRLATNGLPELFRDGGLPSNGMEAALIGPFGNTHPERLELTNFGDIDGPWVYFDERLTPKQYANIARKFQFVATPRGNGVDTHRFWETLYRGSVPIVKSGPWSNQLRYLKLPFLEVDEWQPQLVRQLITKNLGSNFNPRTQNNLWWPEWKNKISSYL